MECAVVNGPVSKASDCDVVHLADFERIAAATGLEDAGTDNAATLTQDGDDNLLDVTQTSTGGANDLTVSQTGNSNELLLDQQNPLDNSTVITQTGNNNYIGGINTAPDYYQQIATAGPNTLDIGQIGNDNVIMLHQDASLSNTTTVVQNNDSNDLSVSQIAPVGNNIIDVIQSGNSSVGHITQNNPTGDNELFLRQ